MIFANVFAFYNDIKVDVWPRMVLWVKGICVCWMMNATLLWEILVRMKAGRGYTAFMLLLHRQSLESAKLPLGDCNFSKDICRNPVLCYGINSQNPNQYFVSFFLDWLFEIWHMVRLWIVCLRARERERERSQSRTEACEFELMRV